VILRMVATARYLHLKSQELHEALMEAHGIRFMAIGRRFMTSKVMERVPVQDWKVGWEVSLILEALRECYPPIRTASSRPPASPTMSTSIAVATEDTLPAYSLLHPSCLLSITHHV
jgi:hypothetical protein